MSPQLSSDAGPIIWSNCSRQDITRFLDRNWGSCLEDEPASEHHELFRYPELPPGAMYNVDHQCRLQYGPEATHCAGMDQVYLHFKQNSVWKKSEWILLRQVCQTLWCKLPDNRCVTRLEPAAPGTHCAKHKVRSSALLGTSINSAYYYVLRRMLRSFFFHFLLFLRLEQYSSVVFFTALRGRVWPLLDD